MKVTISAAMRARDVSRPHAEHLAYAEAAEASVAGSRPAVSGEAVSVNAAVPADARVPAFSAEATVLADAARGDEGLARRQGEERRGETGQDDAAAVDARRGDAGRESERSNGGTGRPGGGRRRFRPRGSGRGRGSR
jgi:hypothetical protein